VYELFLMLLLVSLITLIIRKPVYAAEDYNKYIPDACMKMEDELEEIDVDIQGYYEEENNLLNITVNGDDVEEIYENYLTIFYDIFYYIPIEARGQKYRFELITYSDAPYVEENIAHKILMETSLDLLPGTGGMTEIEWNRFTDQLVYKYDDKDLTLDPPEMFLDED